MKIYGDVQYSNIKSVLGVKYYKGISFSLYELEQNELEKLKLSLTDFLKDKGYFKDTKITEDELKRNIKYTNPKFKLSIERAGSDMANVFIRGEDAEEIEKGFMVFSGVAKGLETRVTIKD